MRRSPKGYTSVGALRKQYMRRIHNYCRTREEDPKLHELLHQLRFNVSRESMAEIEKEVARVSHHWTRLCASCRQPRYSHTDAKKCLFEPTEFTE